MTARARARTAGFVIVVVALGYFVYRDTTRATAVPAPARPVPCTPSGSAALEKAFTDIYAKSTWGQGSAMGTSGTGSSLEASELYRAYVKTFMAKHHITSVVDAGCGDWEFSSAIDWSGIDYKGYDIVPEVIAADTQKYQAPNVHFFTANIVDTELPAADLLVCKNVLQHLPTEAILKFVKQLPKYKYVLLTDGVDPETLSADNTEIQAGQFRRLDPTRPPFGLPGKKVLTYFDGHQMQQVVMLVRGSE